MNKNGYLYDKTRNKLKKAVYNLTKQRLRQFESGLITTNEFLFFMEKITEKHGRVESYAFRLYILGLSSLERGKK